MNAIQVWAELHPLPMYLVIWPLVTAILTAAFKPRTPEAYAELAARHPTWLFVRLAASLQLLGALGLDPVKAIVALQKVVAGNGKPPTPPNGPNVAFVLCSALAFSGCALLEPKNAEAVLDAVQIGCILEHAFVDDPALNALCKLTTPAQQTAARELAKAQRLKAVKDLGARPLTCDGGAP